MPAAFINTGPKTNMLSRIRPTTIESKVQALPKNGAKTGAVS